MCIRDSNQRTQLSGYIPEDIRVWTSNLFTDKIKEEIDLSLRPTALLQNTPVSKFKDILEIGKDSQTLRPTLYEFLAFRALDIQPTVQIYKDLIAFQNKEPNMKSVLLTELDYLRFLYGDKRDKESFEAYMNALDELYRNLASQNYAAEILIAKLDLVSGSMFRYVSTQWDSIKAEEVKLCEEGIKRYSGYPRTAILKNRLAQLEQPTLSASTNNTVYPGQQLGIKLEYKNVQKVIVHFGYVRSVARNTSLLGIFGTQTMDGKGGGAGSDVEVTHHGIDIIDFTVDQCVGIVVFGKLSLRTPVQKVAATAY